MREDQSTPARDEAILSSFGYRQELRRALRLFSLYAVGFSVISITTGITLDYGFAISNFGLAGIWTWLVAGAGQLVVALIIAQLGALIPLAGYASSGAHGCCIRRTAGSSASSASGRWRTPAPGVFGLNPGSLAQRSDRAGCRSRRLRRGSGSHGGVWENRFGSRRAGPASAGELEAVGLDLAVGG